MNLNFSEKAGNCTFCTGAVLPGEPHAELKLSLWPEAAAAGTGAPKHHGLLMVCHRCRADLGITGAEPPGQTLMRLVHELIVREEFARTVMTEPDPEPFQLESYEPGTGFTDDGVDITRKSEGKTGEPNPKTIH